MTPHQKINAQEQTLPRCTSRTLAQLRANKCPLLIEYLHKISPDTHPTPMCPLCNAHTHNTNHLFTCQHIHTTPTLISLWEDPVGVADPLSRRSAVLGWGLVQPWRGPLDQDGLAERSTPPPSQGGSSSCLAFLWRCWTSIHGMKQITFDECSIFTEVVVYREDGSVRCELEFAIFGRQRR